MPAISDTIGPMAMPMNMEASWSVDSAGLLRLM
jgi:hypothetical protein